MIPSATLYAWRERLLAIWPVTVPGSDVENLEVNEDLQALADEMRQAYLDALRREVAK